jgi:ABC-2 type transport system permease protein
MNNLSLWAGDSVTMLRRNLRRRLRQPSMTVLLLGEPIVLQLVFVYVFGGTLGAGLGDLSGGRAAYVDYVTPGILLLTIAFVALGTPISLAMDMTEGIIARFRTMAISRASVLTGHVLGAMIQTMLSVAVVVGVALLLGIRPTAGPLEWIAAIGVLAMVSWALTWLTVALGLVSGSVESASNIALPLVFLPFLGSGFVPTDSMPTGLRWFAEYQPFTPVIETVRGLLMGTEIGSSAVLAVAWCVVITLVGFFWSRALFNRDPSR